MSILLEQDSDTTLQDHLDEASLRTTILFITVAVLTVFWLRSIDAVLETVLAWLQPCQGACLNVYDPARWSATRWFSALFLALLSSTPLIAHHLLAFSRPGLLEDEYIALRRWVIGTGLLLFAVNIFLVRQILPAVFKVTHQQHMGANLTPQYGAVELLTMSGFVMWMASLLLTTYALVVVLGTMGIINQRTSSWWRWRIHGFSSLVLVLSIPPSLGSMTLPFLVLMTLSHEWIGRGFYRQKPSSSGQIIDRFDGEGKRRRLTLLNCSCEGANVHAGVGMTEGFSTHTTVSICRNRHDEHAVYSHLLRERATDAVITGCNTKACPQRFTSNLERMGVNLHGLNLMDLQNHRIGGDSFSTDLELGLLTLGDPFDEANIHERLNLIITKHGLLPRHVVMSTDATPWSNYYPEDFFLVNRSTILNQS